MARQRRIPTYKLSWTVATLALLPLAALLGMGWRLRSQDEALAAQQVAQRTERAADIVVAALQRSVEASRQQMAAGTTEWPAGAAVIIKRLSWMALPKGRLAWLEAVPSLPQAPETETAQGEELEFRRGNPHGAEQFYRRLLDSPRMETRAAGAVRLARVLRNSGRIQEALEVYRGMDRMDGVALEQVPASLVAMHARAELLAHSGNSQEADRVFAEIREDVDRGRWLLTKPVYSLYSDRSRGEQEMLAAAGALLVERWKDQTPGSTGALQVRVQGTSVAVLYMTRGEETRALLALPAFVEAQWLGPAREGAMAQRVRFAILPDGEATHGTRKVPTALRKWTDTTLPWDVRVESPDPEIEMADLLRRQRLYDAAFLLLAVFTLAAAGFTIRALRREAAVSRLQSEFVSAVSHEFRTPLTSLRQFTEMLREGRDLSEERRSLCYQAQARSTDRLTRLVESLLDFNRLESGASPYRLETLDAAALVEQVVEEFRSEAAPADYSIGVAMRSTAEIQADHESLGRAIWNLLDNAVKYSPGVDSVDVEVERRGSELWITVRDGGMGIPHSEQRAIFERFRRGAQASRLGIKGTGIGLAMVDHIVKAHGGRIELESEPGEGSRFSIILPERGQECTGS